MLPDSDDVSPDIIARQLDIGGERRNSGVPQAEVVSARSGKTHPGLKAARTFLHTILPDMFLFERLLPLLETVLEQGRADKRHRGKKTSQNLHNVHLAYVHCASKN